MPVALRAQTADDAQPADTPAAAPTVAAEETAPPRADLTPVNELILEGDYAEADKVLAALESEFPEDPALLLMRGEVLLALGKPDEAREALARSIEIDPQRERSHFQLGSALAALGRNDEAIAAFGDEIGLASDQKILIFAHLNRQNLYAQAKQWEQAAQELEAVVALDPNQLQAYGDMASLYLRAGNSEAAARVLQQGEAAGFVSSPHYYSLGARLYRDEKYEAASQAFRKALEIEPGMARAEKSLAAALEQLGQDQEALEHLKRYLELAPDAPDAAEIREKVRLAENG